MELTDLKIFVSIANEGSVSRAAERLDYVQSNVTARLRKLESELGVSLFHRHPKGVTLTEKGQVFCDYASAILNMAEEAVKVVQEPAEPGGSLTIGIVETGTCGNFMNALADFQTRYPAVSLSLSIGTSAELLTKVLHHQLDGAFVTGNIPSSQLIFDYSTQDELALLTRQDTPTFPKLAETRWAIFPKDCPFRSILQGWLRDEGIALTNIIEISSLEALLSCVRSGLACTLLPRSVLTGEYKHLGTFPVPERFRFINTSLIRRKDRFASKAFMAFVEMIASTGL
ncbi:LysR family transcriptional regulator [Ktedonosporobacter rubrisoli]|uniref:LysR family transcriptional regulator n=1 Tax=Ktedonosporobacter rubrisoli TaxID=2509675 RepID=A0A4P6JS73_KTERU|nr:LysR family transcriptional regulator [Ktedonosporobacter rubrisoli]QBD78359.1 LysR family transcriptional regulator [Ktedonosporobacter rubrisoli]